MLTFIGTLIANFINDFLCVINGQDLPEIVNTNNSSHPKTDTWTSGSTLPTARRGLTTQEVKGTIYVIRGKPELGQRNISYKNSYLRQVVATFGKDDTVANYGSISRIS